MNAFVRGEQLVSVRASFINAGYSPSVVDAAISVAGGSTAGTVSVQAIPARPAGAFTAGNASMQMPAPTVGTAPAPTENFGNRPPLMAQVVKSRMSYWLILLILFLSFGFILLAAVLGLYWNKLF